MKFILIMMWSIHSNSAHTITAEFNTLQACQAASVEIQKQRQAAYPGYGRDIFLDVSTCVQKG